MENKKIILDITQFDPILLGVDRKTVEGHDTGEVISALKTLENSGDDDTELLKSLRGRCSLMVSGYDTEPLELFQIEDFCVWASKLCADYGIFAYFLDSKSVRLIMMATLRAQFIKKGMAQVDPIQQQGFLSLYLMLAIRFGIESGYTKEEMVKYFKAEGLI